MLVGEKCDVETFIKDAVLFYIDNAKANAQMQEMGKALIERLDALATSLQNVSAPGNDFFSNLAGLMLSCAFETQVTHLILKEHYYRDGRAAAEYERLCGSVLSGIDKQCKDNETSNLLKLREENRLLQNRHEETSGELAKVTKERSKLNCNYMDLLHRYKNLTRQIENTEMLIEWYERLIREVPKIRQRNSGLIWVQSWEEALAEFIRDDPKPQV
jgi:chromosome segregation ATPase